MIKLKQLIDAFLEGRREVVRRIDSLAELARAPHNSYDTNRQLAIIAAERRAAGKEIPCDMGYAICLAGQASVYGVNEL